MSPPWQLIPSREAARLLGVSLQVMANMRVRDTGPPFDNTIRGRGNKTFYRFADVLAWAARRQGQQVEAWEICRDWLVEHGLLKAEDASPDAVEWMISRLGGRNS